MNSINVLCRTSVVVSLSTKQCPKYLTKQKSTNSKKDDLNEKIKIKTPIGNVLGIICLWYE